MLRSHNLCYAKKLRTKMNAIEPDFFSESLTAEMHLVKRVPSLWGLVVKNGESDPHGILLAGHR
jgi:hypothetical protein